MIPLGSKLAPARGSQVGTIIIEKVEFILWGKLTQVSDPGPSWPSCFFFFCQGYKLQYQDCEVVTKQRPVK